MMNLVSLISFNEWMSNAWAWIKDFFSQPVPIIGCSVLFLSIFLIKFIATTSIGRKAINELKTKFEEFKKWITEKLENSSKQFEEFKNDCNKMLKQYEEELTKKDEYIANLENFILEVLSQNHNKNVKVLIEKYKAGVEHGREKDN